MSPANFIPADERERELVRNDTGGMLVVEAGAGTGKTTLLIDRLMTLLVANDIAQLVAITFTEKAAGELAERLRRELEKRVLDGVKTTNIHYSKALAAIDNANLSTIHAFASSLLRIHPIDAGLDPDFEVIEPADEQELLDEALAEEMGRPDLARDAALQLLIELGAKMGKIRLLFGALAENIDLVGDDFAVPSDEALFEMLDKIARQLREMDQRAQEGGADMEDKAIVNIRQLSKSLSAIEGKGDWKRLYEWMLGVAGMRGGVGSAKSWRDQNEGKQFKSDYAELKLSAQRAADEVRGSVLCRTLNQLGRATRKVMQQKLERGVLTFDDLLVQSQKLLENPDVLEELQARFHYLLIDEFQDTDPIQARIALKLAGLTESKTGGLQVPAGRLCVVGDPKQSIYRFRRADSRMFNKATEEIEQFGSRVRIIQNFRSATGLIEFVNCFFASIWPSGAEAGGVEYLPLVAEPARPIGNPSPPVLFLTPPEGATHIEEIADVARRKEAVAIARTVHNAVEIEKWSVSRRKKVGSRELQPAEWGDIAILFPRTTGLDFYTEELEKLGIPFIIAGGKAAYRRQLAMDLVNVLTAIDNPADELAVIGAIRSSLLAVPDDEIAIWRDLSVEMNYITPPDGIPAHINEALSLLRRLHRARASATPDKLIQIVLDETNARAALLCAPGGTLDEELLDIVLNQAKRWGVERGADLRGFRRRLSKLIEVGDDPDAAPPPTAAGRIRLMTIHAAKGLEFPVVFLANPGAGGGGNRSIKVIPDRLEGKLHIAFGGGTSEEPLFATPGFEAAQAEEDKELQAERVRLLYVAMTRACDHLVLPIFRAKKNDSDFQKWLAELVSGDTIFKDWQRALFRIDQNTDELAVSHIDQVNEPSGFESVFAERNRLLELRERAVKESVDGTLRIIRPSAAEDGKREEDYQPLIGDEKPLRIGRALHRYMALTQLCSEVDDRLLEAVCKEEEVLTEELRNLIEVLLNSTQWQSAIVSGSLLREVPVLAKCPDGAIRGNIDLVWVEDNKVQIADYKSGAIGSVEQVNQLRLYAEAIERSTGTPVIHGWLISARDGHTIDALI